MLRKTNSGKSLLHDFPLTLLCVALTWYLCLIRTTNMHLPTFDGFDKCVHVCMYLGTCSVFWVEYFRSHRQASRIALCLVAVVAPILMSGIIELAQEYCTTCRTGDWFDFAANSLGVLLALALSPLYKSIIRRYA